MTVKKDADQVEDKVKTGLFLSVNERRFKTLIENSRDGIILSNSERKVIYASPAVQEATGYTPDEMIGKRTFDMFHPEEESENMEFFQKNVMGKSVLSASRVLRIRHKDGAWRWVELTATNKLDDPAINAIVTNFRDITDKKNAEEALLYSERKYRALIENNKEGIALINRERQFLYLSPASKQILGYEPEELVGTKTVALYHPDDQIRIRDLVLALTSGAISGVCEVLRVRHKDGEWRWMELTLSNQYSNPAINALVANFRDMDEKKKAEELLLNSERKFRALIENSKDGICLSDPEARFIYLSPAIKEILGYDPEEMIGKYAYDMIHADFQESNLMNIFMEDGSIKSNADITIKVRHKNGTWRWVEASVSMRLDDPAVQAVVTNFRDVTSKKINEEAIQNSEKRFRKLIENNKDGIGLTNSNQEFIYLSPSVKSILGYEPEELIGTKAFEHYHPDDLPAMVDLAKSIRNETNASASAQARIRHKDGNWRWIELTATNQLDDPAISAIVTNFRDVTERKKAEEAIIYSEQRFKTLIEKNQDVITLSSAEGFVTYMSPSIKELLNYDPWELLGTPAMGLMHPDELEANIGHLMWCNENPGKSMFMTLRLHHKDGSWRWVEATSTSQLHNPAVNAIVSNLRDITARKSAQDELGLLNQSLEKKVEERTMQLAESNKALESFSSLAAHDLQAPLRILSGYSAMISHDYADKLGEDGCALLDVIRKQTGHMSQLVSDLLTFSRASHTIMKEEQVDVHAMVNGVADELCLLSSNGKTPEIKISELGSSSCDAHLMRQVWANLISNALKYSGKKEKPQVEIGRTRGEGENIYYVRDNGAGFDAKHQHKLFQVFQRLHTASDFEGTGVGLALVKNVVARHGGRVWADSELGQGATFYFSMPD